MYFASHSAIAPFTLHRPSTPAQAVALLNGRPDSAFLAGGVDLIPLLRGGKPVTDVVCLDGLTGLADIRATGDALQIGAGATFDQLLANADLTGSFPELARLAADIGNIRVRCAATLGGNLAAQNAGYDLLPLLLVSDATIRVQTAGGETIWSCKAGSVDWAPQGLIERIDLPTQQESHIRYERRFKPVASVALGFWQEDGGWRGRAVVGCAFDRFWTADLPDGVKSPEAAARSAGDLAQEMTGDMPLLEDGTVASGAYRQRLIRTVLRRQLESLAA